MNKSFLMKIGASLMAIMLMTACNNSDTEKKESGTGTEQKVDDEKQADQTSTDESKRDQETSTDTESSDQ
ncbi:hypothetical protein M1K46_04160 [Fictibacillus sp. WQ 8-8]|uniref:hypothetical protein n=1 Tax=Fictibacillus sp. WQ 8-8 TaxID=2938788 RepID=UPI00210A058A|nr:hypothetical protein [Fictibacillus sp. WQ 8-8]MCQ6264862.1 hypothetical protein [Fictibacillus sp. WQ 8-8]